MTPTAPPDSGRKFKPRRLKSLVVPYLLILPGVVWLAIFFVIPLLAMASLSLQTGDVVGGFRQTFSVSNYWDAVSSYHVQLIRSLLYGLITTILCILLAFPVAYWLAYRAGPRRNSYLLLLLLPFFVTFVLRTLSWRYLLADDGIILGPLKRWGVLPHNLEILNTTYAVIGGLTYGFLPFMVLPLYVALERIDVRLLEAADDLYSSKARRFLRVVLPLSLPGLSAGFLLTFVPAASDYVNAQVLGGVNQTMVGNLISTQYLADNNYPGSSALSGVLMAILLLCVFGYARTAGTRDVLDAASA
jgi:spermidine/putrescine transport system permease protein